MIWVEIVKGRFYSGSTGTEKTYPLPLQDWGLQIKDVIAALVILGRSSTNVRFRLFVNEIAVDDLNAAITTGTDVIGTSGAPSSAPAAIPGTVKGSAAGPFLPYLRFVIGVSGTGGVEEWIDVRAFGGGKQY